MSSVKDLIFTLTIRLTVLKSDGQVSTGTGFFHSLTSKQDEVKLFVVTNKHVVEDAVEIVFVISSLGEDGNRNPADTLQVSLKNLENFVQLHPDGLDLAIFPFLPVLNELKSKADFEASLKCLNNSQIISEENFINDLYGCHDVYMVGYPIGLTDNKNNLPIVRRGICATPPGSKFNGKSEFLIDMHCFPGSSGSPVFVIDEGSFNTKSGSLNIGTRFGLLGILYGGPIYNSQGSIVVKPPTQTLSEYISTSIPTGLGFCISATELVKFDAVMKEYNKDWGATIDWKKYDFITSE